MSRNLARLGLDILKSNFGPLSKPYKLNYVVTKECHSKCVHCHIWKQTPHNELTLSEIEKFTAHNPHFRWVNFSGGEPTDRKDFVEVVSAFVRSMRGLCLLHFPTNGLKPEVIEDVARRIVSLNPPSLLITVSIDGPPELHDRLRGVPGNFDLAVETLQRLSSIPQIKSFVGMTLYASNHKFITETYNAVSSKVPGFHWDRFHVNLPHVAPHYYQNEMIKRTRTPEMLESLREYQKARPASLSPVNLMERQFHKWAEEFLLTGITPLPCSALNTSCFLGETGIVYPCSMWDRPLGNIREHNYDLTPLLKSQAAHQAKDLIAQKSCAQCWTPCEAFQTMGSQLPKFLKSPQVHAPVEKLKKSA